jgi:hypothetical protein
MQSIFIAPAKIALTILSKKKKSKLQIMRTIILIKLEYIMHRGCETYIVRKVQETYSFYCNKYINYPIGATCPV